jgi:hypothetical protein
MPTRILIGGLDGAGKSTLTCSVAEALRHDGIAVHTIEIDPWSDTHDVIYGRKPVEKRNGRHEVAIGEFRERVEMFRHSPYPVVLGDMQGRQQYQFNFLLEGIADRGILVGREPTPKDEKRASEGILQTLDEWEELFDQLETHVDLYVHSLLPGQCQSARPRLCTPEMSMPAMLERKLHPYSPYVQQLKNTILAWSGLTPDLAKF